MNQYHFNVMLEGEPSRDHTGLKLGTLTDARVQATRLAADLVNAAAEGVNDWEIRVANDAGLTLFCLNVLITDAPAMKR